jgi:surface antigen
VCSTRRFTCSLLLAVLAALLPLSPPAAHASSTYICSGYTGCHGKGYSHFGYRSAGRHMWWRMYAGHNCTNYVAYRLVRAGMSATRPWNGSGNADNWGRKKPGITDGKPMVGAVAWWKRNVPGAGSSGHVAYVERVLSRTEIVVSEDSWSGDFHWRRITKSGTGWPSGFIHFKDRKLTVKSRPEVSGRPMVGEPLVATAGRWSMSSKHTFHWYADGERIRGASSARYTPGPDMQGRRLSMRVTARRSGYLTGASFSARTARVARGHLENLSPPEITGTVRVGEVLEVGGAAWSPRPDSTSIRWFAGRDPIPGARDDELRLSPAQLGKRISVRVTARKERYRRSAVVSERTRDVASGRFDITSPFRLRGGRMLGGRMEVERGTFAPSGATVTYTWLRNGRAISGATGSSYVPQVFDVGDKISVRVELSREGYRDKRVLVEPKGLIRTRPTLLVWTEGRAQRAVVQLKVKAAGVDTPRGRATVRIGRSHVSGRLEDGRLRVVVRDLDPGLHRVRVAYLGTEVVVADRVVTTVRVRRR